MGLAKTIHFSLSQPLHPYEQLLSVLPPDRAFLLPEPYRPIMIDPSSPVADFYPRQVQIDSDGTHYHNLHTSHPNIVGVVPNRQKEHMGVYPAVASYRHAEIIGCCGDACG